MAFNPGSFTGVAGEIRMFGCAMIVGAVLGAVYDILRALRMSFPHRFAAVFAEDVLFVLFSGMVYFSFSVEMLEGELRLYVAVGMLAGFSVYILTLGRVISDILGTAGKVLRKILSKADNILRKGANFIILKLKNLTFAKKFSGKIKKSS